jgi:hypothetical protein
MTQQHERGYTYGEAMDSLVLAANVASSRVKETKKGQDCTETQRLVLLALAKEARDRLDEMVLWYENPTLARVLMAGHVLTDAEQDPSL